MAVGFRVRWSFFAYFWRPGGFHLGPAGRWVLGCYGFVFPLSCGIVSVALNLGESGAGDLGDGGVHLARVVGFVVGCLEGCLTHGGQDSFFSPEFLCSL